MGTKKAQRKMQRSARKALAAAKAKAKTPPGFDHCQIVINPPGQVKMSEVLEEFMAPYLTAAPTEVELHHIVPVAMLAWNAAFRPAQERQALINQIVAGQPAQAQGMLRQVLEELVARKIAYFASYQRRILDDQVTQTKEGPCLSVISTLE